VRNILIVCFLLVAEIVLSQPSDSLLLFSGYVLDQDSFPIENAMLVNYRTLKPKLTNEKGYFKIWVMKGDSLLINHISYERRIVNANNLGSDRNKFYIPFSPYEIKAVNIKYRDIEMENFHKNMKHIYVQMKMNTPTYHTGTEYNSYAPQRKDQVAGINIIELINLIKTNKYKKGK